MAGGGGAAVRGSCLYASDGGGASAVAIPFELNLAGALDRLGGCVI